MITFAETYQQYPDGQQNVVALPESITDIGFIPAQPNAKGQPLPAQWLNWLFQKVFRNINRDIITDESGARLFIYPESIITLTAFEKANPANFLFAVGYKGAADAVHTLKVIDNLTLELGVGSENGDQPVINGTGLIVCGTSRQTGDL
jgi:hypothetical protein